MVLHFVDLIGPLYYSNEYKGYVVGVIDTFIIKLPFDLIQVNLNMDGFVIHIMNEMYNID